MKFYLVFPVSAEIKLTDPTDTVDLFRLVIVFNPNAFKNTEYICSLKF